MCGAAENSRSLTTGQRVPHTNGNQSRTAGRRAGKPGEFDPGSGRTLAACLMHASRAHPTLRRRVSGARVRSTWGTCPGAGTSASKGAVMAHTARFGNGPGESGDAPREGPAAH